MRNQFHGSEERLAGNVLAQEPASPALNAATMSSGFCEAARMTTFTRGIRRDDFAHERIGGGKAFVDAGQPHAALDRAEVAL